MHTMIKGPKFENIDQNPPNNGEGYGLKRLPYEVYVLENHAELIKSHNNNAEKLANIQEVVRCLYNVNSKKYWRKILRESENLELVEVCLKNLDCKYKSYVLVRCFTHQLSIPNNPKVKKILESIKIRRYLFNALKALDKMHSWCIVEDISYGDLKMLINKHLETSSKSVDYILD